MKITEKAVRFMEELIEAIEKNGDMIGNEFKRLTGLSGGVETKYIDRNGADIFIIRPSCGRGCCPEETVGKVSVLLRDLKYPSLKINSMREESKYKKISNAWAENSYRDKDKAEGKFYKKDKR